MLQLSNYVLGKTKNIDTIPNLIYRKNNIITATNIYSETTNDIISNISFSHFELLKNYKKYLTIRQNTLHTHPETVYFSV